MRYALIREMDISNGPGIRVSLFVQGCHFHCKGCFNQETWDFAGGKEWNDEIEDYFLDLCDKPEVKGISLLGGEPLNQPEDLLKVVRRFKVRFPEKTVWLWTGFRLQDIDPRDTAKWNLLRMMDTVVDGQFIEEEHRNNLKNRGSLNQQIRDGREIDELYQKLSRL